MGLAPKEAKPDSSRLMSKLLTNQVFAIDMQENTFEFNGYNQSHEIVAHRVSGSFNWALSFLEFSVNGQKKRPLKNNVLLDTGSNALVVPKEDLRFILDEICKKAKCFQYQDTDIVIEDRNFIVFPHDIYDCANANFPSLQIQLGDYLYKIDAKDLVSEPNPIYGNCYLEKIISMADNHDWILGTPFL